VDKNHTVEKMIRGELPVTAFDRAERSGMGWFGEHLFTHPIPNPVTLSEK
jgi:hypothetical protein